MSASRTAHVGRVRSLLEPVLAAAGCDLEELTITPAGRRRVVRVVVDRDGGLTLDDVAELSRGISTVLDETDAGPATPYELEVSSPGVDRPLRAPRHWRRARGRLVRVAVANLGVRTARVVAADEDEVTLDLDGAASRHPYRDLGPGAVQVEFDSPAEETTDDMRPGMSADPAGLSS